MTTGGTNGGGKGGKQKQNNATLLHSLAPLISGVAGGSASTVLLYPLDLIKVRIQVNEDPTTFFRRDGGGGGGGTPDNQGVRRATMGAAASPPLVEHPKPAGGGGEGLIRSRSPPRPRRRTILCTLRGVVRHEGVLGLYQGLTPALAGSAVSWGGYFFFYERLKASLLDRKRRRHQHQPIGSGPVGGDTCSHEEPRRETRLGPTENFFAACASGAVMVLLTNPMWLIKTRMQLQVRLKGQQQQALQSAEFEGAKPQYKGMMDAAKTIVREEGPLALYKGSIPAMMLVSHGGVQFVTYEFLKGHFGNYTKAVRGASPQVRGRTVVERLQDSFGYLTMGAISKIIASTTTYPLQVIKARLQQRSQALELSDSGKFHLVNREYSGVVDCTRKIWVREGLEGFFKGCLPNAIRVAPSAAITFVVYETVMDWIVGYEHRQHVR